MMAMVSNTVHTADFDEPHTCYLTEACDEYFVLGLYTVCFFEYISKSEQDLLKTVF